MPVAGRAAARRAPQLEKYEKVRELGRGSQGTVWLVRRRADRKLLAMKSVLLPPLVSNEEKAVAQRRQALREVDILQQLESPHLVGYHEAILAPASLERPQSELHIVTEYCDGGDLDGHLRKSCNGQGLPEDDVWKVATTILLGLRELHARSILHRDLKPANVFLKRAKAATAVGQLRSRAGRSPSRGRREGSAGAAAAPVAAALDFSVVVGDLGVAREMSESQPLASTMIGTPLYCAPEIFEGQPYGEKADVYSFGVCVYECMHGRPPFAKVGNMGALVRQVLNLDGQSEETRLPMDLRYSHKLRSFVSSCLGLSPEQRPAVTELLNRNSVLQVSIQCNAERLLAARAEPSSGASPPSAKHLVRHSSQPRVACVHSPSTKPALVRSPSLPAAPVRGHSPRDAPRTSVVSPAGRQRSPVCARRVSSASPRAHFGFQPPRRRPAPNARPVGPSAPNEEVETIKFESGQCGSSVEQSVVVASPSEEVKTIKFESDQSGSSVEDSVVVLAEALQSPGAQECGSPTSLCQVGLPCGRAPAKESPGHPAQMCSASHVCEHLVRSSSAPALCAEEHASGPAYSQCNPLLDFSRDLTLKVPTVEAQGHPTDASIASSSSAEPERTFANGGDAKASDPVTAKESLQLTMCSDSIDVTPRAIAIEVQSFVGGEEPENEMGDTLSDGFAVTAALSSVPPLKAFSPPRSVVNPTAPAVHAGASCLSARSNQAYSPSVVSSRASARSIRSPCDSLRANSPQCVGGRVGLRQRSKGYVAKAHECFSRWRREKFDAKAVEKESSDRTAKRSFSVQHVVATEPDFILEVRGVAPPPTPVSKRVARGSLAAARVLYTPPTRRAKGVRV